MQIHMDGQRFHNLSRMEEVVMTMNALVVLHRNVDLDAVISAYILYLRGDIKSIEAVITEDRLENFLKVFEDLRKIYVLDMPLKPEIKELAEKYGVEIEHYDHHDGSAPSTAQILYEKFKDQLPEWVKYLVELANFSDTGKVLRQPAPIKYFHLTGYINALRTGGKTDDEIIAYVFPILDDYKEMLQKLVEAEKLVEDIKIFGIGDEYKVAIVENKPHTVNQILFEHKNVDFIIFKDGDNLGVTRNALIDQPDLNKLKPHLKKKLEEKGKPEEFEEWFFHPAGFIMARGTRKHPAKTPSVLNPYDLLTLLAKL